MNETGKNADRPGPFSRAASRTLDRISIEEHHVPSLILMEHASIGIALAALQQLRALGRAPEEGRVEIVCGPGNNGGDGLAAARHLWNRGVSVVIWELVTPGGRAAGTDSAVQLEIAQRFGVPIIDASRTLPPPPSGETHEPLPDLRLDAIFGTGLSRPPDGIHRDAIERLCADPVPVLAVDIPSGLDADRGTPLEIAVEAALTVTLGLPKIGFLSPGSESFTGELRCVPIGASRKLLPPEIPVFPPAPHALQRSPGGEAFAWIEPEEDRRP